LIGYIAAGALIRRLPWALAAAATWAIAMELLVTVIAQSEGARYGGENALVRILGAIFVGWLTFVISQAIRRRRKAAAEGTGVYKPDL
jgi:hypothetical protein